MDGEMDAEELKNTLEECKTRCTVLEKEREKLMVNFEEKREKFKEVYQAKEKLVVEQASELNSLRDKLNQNEHKISEMVAELKDLKMIASVSEDTKQEAVDNLEKRHQEEMESLRKAMEESNEESQQEMVRHFERERRQWGKQMATMKLDKEALEMQFDEARRKIEHDARYPEEEELESSMKKAHAEAEKLKSVILPLENEISNLKEELKATRKDLEESRNLSAELNAKAAAKLQAEETASKTEQTQHVQDSTVELDRSSQCEKPSRTDLEKDAKAVQERKIEVENERDALQEKIKIIHKQFDQEKAEHAVLKQTWLAANDQFLEAQRLLMRDNNIIEGILSEEQRRQVKMLKLKAQASEAREAKSPMSSLALLKSKTDKFKEVVADSISQKSETDSDTQSFGSYQDFQEVSESRQQKVTLKLTLPDSKTTLLERESDYIEADQIVPGPGQKVIDESEYNDMLHELRMMRNKAARSSGTGMSASTSKHKHADLFEDDAKMTAEIETLTVKLKAYEDEKAKESERTGSLEESIKCSAEDAQKQITELANKLADFERLVGNLKEKQIKAKAQDINTIVKFTKEKDKYRDELFASKKERDRLGKLQHSHQQTLLKEASSTSASPEVTQKMMGAYRQALAATRAEKDNLETKLKNEIVFMEERLKAEQSTREQLESSLASELHDARGEIISLRSLESVKDDLDKARKEKAECELLLDKGKTSYQALQSKSNEIIKGLREKHLAEIRAKERVESALSDAKNKLHSLHGALETSEHVQREFVRLSQSLQVELEQVRQDRERENRSDADTNSVQSLDFSQAGRDDAAAIPNSRSPALSPEQARREEPRKTNSSN